MFLWNLCHVMGKLQDVGVGILDVTSVSCFYKIYLSIVTQTHHLSIRRQEVL